MIDTRLTNLPQTNPLCATWNEAVCLACANRTFFDQNLICQPVSDFCQTWDRQSGNCLTCYDGYRINNNQCILVQRPAVNVGIITVGTVTGIDSNGDGIIDYCKRYQTDELTNCIECVPRAYFDSFNVCQPISDLCRTFNQQNGRCTACYFGYALEQTSGACVLDPAINGQPSDLGCGEWNWELQICLRCSQRFAFDEQGMCRALDDFCQEFSNDGSCIQCYRGYRVSAQGTCERFVQELTDLGCA